MRSRHVVFSVLVIAASLTVPIPPVAASSAGAPGWRTELVSVSSTGTQTDSESMSASLSSNGRHVAFASMATNLVAGDTNDTWDVFVRDRLTQTTTRVSVTDAGEQGENASSAPVISADGRYVAFASHAHNLLGEADANGDGEDIFVYDRWTGANTLVSRSLTGAGGNARSRDPEISADGKYVAFFSFSSDLVADGSTLGGMFVRNMRTGVTIRASLTSTGAPAGRVGDGALSGNGR